jgi:hypothetical protein
LGAKVVIKKMGAKNKKRRKGVDLPGIVYKPFEELLWPSIRWSKRRGYVVPYTIPPWIIEKWHLYPDYAPGHEPLEETRFYIPVEPLEETPLEETRFYIPVQPDPDPEQEAKIAHRIAKFGSVDEKPEEPKDTSLLKPKQKPQTKKETSLLKPKPKPAPNPNAEPKEYVKNPDLPEWFQNRIQYKNLCESVLDWPPEQLQAMGLDPSSVVECGSDGYYGPRVYPYY